MKKKYVRILLHADPTCRLLYIPISLKLFFPSKLQALFIHSSTQNISHKAVLSNFPPLTEPGKPLGEDKT